MRLPFVKRSTLNKLFQDCRIQVNTADSARRQAESDLRTAKKIIKDVLPRLFKIDVSKNIDYETYRVCIDIHRDMIERAFTHGGSQQEIEYMASMLGEQVGRKMIQFNFARCSR